MANTVFERIWEQHVVMRDDDGASLLHVDRHVLHDLGAQRAFAMLHRSGRPVRAPELTIAVHDHIVSSQRGRRNDTYPEGAPFAEALSRDAPRHHIRLFDLDDPSQGIVHVIAPELGIALPGVLLACGDSHTCTVGGVGAVGIGVGTSEVEHVLATQTLLVRQPHTMRVRFTGTLPEGLTAKDMALFLIGTIGAKGASGHAIEYAGPAVSALSIEGRLTLCNMSIECGARTGLVAPDDTTLAYVHDRSFAPRGSQWDIAEAAWRRLVSAPDATFDRDVALDVSHLAPHVTWGTSPAQVVAVNGRVPETDAMSDAATRDSARRAMEYMGLIPGTALQDLKVDRAFIGSCTNGRISDLRAAAAVLAGRRIAPHVKGLVVPGASQVKRQAEAEGLDRIFESAGFEWRESACSMCAGVNDDRVMPQERCISSSNRNFEGRQGPGARTHLASPATVAASAIAGHIADVRVAMH